MPVLHGLAQGPGGAYSSLLLKNLYVFAAIGGGGGSHYLIIVMDLNHTNCIHHFYPKIRLK